MKKAILLFLSFAVHITTSLHATMLLYMYTDSHQTMLNEYFLPSLNKVEPQLKLIGHHIEQTCSSASFYDIGWTETVQQKLSILKSAGENHPDEIIIYSDVDIIFNRPFVQYIEQALAETEFLIQAIQTTAEHPQSGICSGFMAFRPTPTVIKVLEKALQRMKDGKARGDQSALTHILYNDSQGLHWRVLPHDEFCLYKWGRNHLWEPDMPLHIPTTARLFHACYTKGTTNKEAMLQHAKEQFNQDT